MTKGKPLTPIGHKVPTGKRRTVSLPPQTAPPMIHNTPKQSLDTSQQVDNHFDDSISQTAFDMNTQQLNQAIGIQLALMLKESRLDETEDSSDDLFEKREKQFEEEKKFQEKEKKKKEKMRQEAAAKVLEKNLKVPREVVASLKELERLTEKIGLLKLLKNVKSALKEKNVSLAKEELREYVKKQKSKMTVLTKMKDYLEKSAKRSSVTPEKLSKEITRIAETDKNGINGEVAGLAERVKRLSKKEGIGAVKDFVQRKSIPIKALQNLEKLAKEWDKLSPKQISSRLKAISKKWRVETVRLWKNAAVLSGMRKTPEKFIKTAKDLFRGEAKMLDAIKRKWTKGIIDFAKEKLLKAYQKKNKKEMGFWEGAVKELNKMRGISISDFNKKLGILLKDRPKELATAKTRAAALVVGHIQGIADGIERSKYLKKIESISKLAQKEKMKGPLGRILVELRDLKEKIDILIKGSGKELDRAFAEIAKSTGSLGAYGKIMIKTLGRDRKKEKKKMISDLLGKIDHGLGTMAAVEGMKKHAEKGRYDQVDEMGEAISRQISRLQKANTKLSSQMKLPKAQQRQAIIKTISSLLSSPPLRGSVSGKKSAQI